MAGAPANLEPVQDLNLTLQEQLSLATGLEIKGALGGLPVAEQNQAYFAIFSEAGDTGPEIIDKTQFRISYLVDGDLNTSKPSSDGVAALNATQNFEKGKNVIVRADNATVLNQNLTGEKSIYDIGTIKLLCTTETGSSVGAYIPTMSFNNDQGQDIITDAQNLTGIFSANDGQDTTNFNWYVVNYANTIQAISQSNGTEEWIDFGNNQYWELLQDTTTAGTRIYFEGNIFAQVEWDDVGGDVAGEIEIQQYNSITGVWTSINNTTFTIPNGSLSYYYPLVSTVSYKNYTTGTRFRIRYRKIGPSAHTLKVRDGRFNCKQEYTPGDVAVVGLNATTSPYFTLGAVSSFTGSTADSITSYSVITSSVSLGGFANGEFTVDLDPLCLSFDPNNNGVAFSPIQTPFEFKVGDEIRFEYNKNKVHKIIEVSPTTSGRIALWVTPQVEDNTELSHFTHYRIVQDGGYLIANVIKNNDNNEYQPFSGIILPKYPSTKIKEREEKLIYDLKQANIIED